MAKEKSEVVNKKEVVITVDNTEAEVLQYNLDKGVLMKFDLTNFKRLPDSVVKELRYENQKAYFIAEGAKRNPKFEAPPERPDFDSPLEIGREGALKIRERPGYHQCWVMGTLVSGNSGEVEMYKEVGYQPVRRKKNPEEKPGEESGEIIKMHDFGKSELIAMEVKQELYDKHVQAMARKSVSKYKAMKEDFAKNVDNINRERPRQNAAVVVDDEGDVG